MKFNTLKTGDLVEFKRSSSNFSECFTNRGIFLGFSNDITPSRMSNYIRVHMIEFGGRLFSAICWAEKDSITKIL